MTSESREERVVLVDEHDRPVGVEEKLAAHREGGLLHRAFSIFIRNARGEMLLQRRAATKYHFRGLWANACCGHPRPGEETASAARRRLHEELGIDAELAEAFSFVYSAEDPATGLTERELDHVLVGRFDGIPQPHPDEIDEVRWVSPEALERELEESPERFAPWFREAAPRLAALDEGRDEPPSPSPPVRRRSRLFIVALLFVVFLATVLMRAPWRGFLARGDSFVTGQALRWLRTWHRDGAWATSFALVLSPPTDAYQGEQKLLKWALPGHLMIAHSFFWLSGLEPTVDRIMQVNLAIHLALALVLALLAHYLAALVWPDRPRWVRATALHCGLFVLLLPPLLFWGQGLSCQYFTVLPFLVIVVGARWLRASVPAARHGSVDRVVRISVFLGTITDFVFWTLVPYLLVVRGLRARKGRPRTSDPWRETLLRPYLAAMVFLFVVFVLTGQIPTMIGRAMAWTIGEEGGGGLLFFLVTRVWFFFEWAFGYFLEAFSWLGFFCLGLGLFALVVPRTRARLPWMVRGVLVDLFFSSLLLTFVLSPHQAVHTFSAMLYVPFLALAWTLLTPALLDRLGGRKKRRLAWAVYAPAAFLLIWPGTSGYRQYFPVPEIGWSLEARFLREGTLPSDLVVSPTTEIDILPPQRMALAERAVHHVYGPLDLARLAEEKDDTDRIVLYGPADLASAFGARAASSRATTHAGLGIARVPVWRYRELAARRSDARYRDHVDEVLGGGLFPEPEELEPYEGELAPPERPVAMHVAYGPGAGGGLERLYWEGARRYHAVTSSGQFVVRGDEVVREAFIGMWIRADEAEEVDERPAELGAFLLGAFEREGGERFQWRGYEVIRVPMGSGPRRLRERAPTVESWDAYLVHDDAGAPAAMALGPSGGGTAWVSVVFDEIVCDVGNYFEDFEEWRIVKQPEA